MKKYERTDHEDYMLAAWWAEITVDGSRDRLFVPPTSLGRVIAYFQDPAINLVYEADARGLWFAMWFTPMFAGMSASLWCRQDMRHKRAHLEAAERGYGMALEAVPVLIGLTRKELIRQHEMLGYTVVGQIPELIQGQETYVVALTRDGWRNRRHGWSARRGVIVGG